MGNVNSRIKEVREEKGYSQERLAQEIGLKRNTITLIENNKRNPSERTKRDICKLFKLNYLWLDEGRGGKFSETPEEIFDEVRKEYDLDEEDISILKDYAGLQKGQRKRLKAYIKALINTKEEG